MAASSNAFLGPLPATPSHGYSLSSAGRRPRRRGALRGQRLLAAVVLGLALPLAVVPLAAAAAWPHPVGPRGAATSAGPEARAGGTPPSSPRFSMSRSPASHSPAAATPASAEPDPGPAERQSATSSPAAVPPQHGTGRPRPAGGRFWADRDAAGHRHRPASAPERAEAAAEQAPDSAPDAVPGSAPGSVPGRTSEQAPEQALEQAAEQAPEQPAGQPGAQVPDRSAETAPPASDADPGTPDAPAPADGATALDSATVAAGQPVAVGPAAVPAHWGDASTLQLPLGAGLGLIGCGLGLIGLRLRKG
ncbi:hypothetical protein [Kitasatospora sp. NPDC087315]|uniref:hypothetical protein n=1 Tax=Kitasatospora sp. NPDC087315 TaxID=3364069 RepID=UPI00382B1C3A